MSVTEYVSDGMEIGGNTRFTAIAGASVTDINALSAAAVTAGTRFEGATNLFGASISHTPREARKVADSTARQRPGTRTYQAEALVLDVEDPKALDPIFTMLGQDKEVVIVVRPGVPIDEPAAAGDPYIAYRVIVATQEWNNFTSDDGAVYQVTHELMVQERSTGLTSTMVA